MKDHVFICMPHYGPIEAEAGKSFWCEATENDELNIINANKPSSLLARNFNDFWCMALDWHLKNPDARISHFAMLHADVVPQRGWLDILLAELKASDADICSAVVPIKSDDGVTSTAISSADPFRVTRRLTMKEIMQLPATFDAESCGYPGETLLVNTGCWAARFDRLWRFDVHFEILDKIVTHPDGRHEAKTCSEDWNFSNQVSRHGGKIVATRKVGLKHVGPNGWPNDREWGLDIDHMALGKKLPVFG